jgi:zinc transport system permease protein
MSTRVNQVLRLVLLGVLLPLVSVAAPLPNEPLGGHKAVAKRVYIPPPKPPTKKPTQPPIKPVTPVVKPTQTPATKPATTAPAQNDVDDFAKALGEEPKPTSASAPTTGPAQNDIDDFANLLNDSASKPSSGPIVVAASEPSAPANPGLEDSNGALIEPGGAFSEAMEESKSSFLSWKSYEVWRDPITVNAFAALICGFLGVYVIMRRMVFVSATISQLSSVGVVLGFYLSILLGISRSEEGEASNAGLLGFLTNPLWLAIGFSMVGAAFFALNAERKRMSQESLIGISYSIAAGLVLAILNSKTMNTEAHAVEAILFGDAAIVEPSDPYVVGAVALLVLGFHLYFFRAFLFSSFDATTAKTLGIDPKFFSVLLLMSLGLVISVATRAIGPMPVFAYLVIPPAAAILLSDQLKLIFLLGPVFGVFSAVFGYYLSWTLEMPTTAAVVIVAGFTLLPGLIKRGIERWRKPA